eukprot:4163212-Amphidinium_carterae.1
MIGSRAHGQPQIRLQYEAIKGPPLDESLHPAFFLRLYPLSGKRLSYPWPIRALRVKLYGPQEP